MGYELECPRCEMMLDYVIEFANEGDLVGYWCHNPSCRYRVTYIYKKDIKKHYKIFAPFSKEQIKLLYHWQGYSKKDLLLCKCGYGLIPREGGLYCGDCSYEQNWCYNFMLGEEDK